MKQSKLSLSYELMNRPSLSNLTKLCKVPYVQFSGNQGLIKPNLAPVYVGYIVLNKIKDARSQVVRIWAIQNHLLGSKDIIADNNDVEVK